MEYFFQGGVEMVKVDVNYVDRTIKIASRLTGFSYQPLHKILSNKKSMVFYGYIQKMSDKEFDGYLEDEFKKMGYQLKKKK